MSLEVHPSTTCTLSLGTVVFQPETKAGGNDSMVVILILGVLWGVVLIPAGLRRFKSQASHQSIDSFHHSLHLLEHSGPKIVEPAYRLVGSGHDSLGGAANLVLRPRLELLRPAGQEEETDMSTYSDDRFDDDLGDERFSESEDSGFSYRPSFADRSYARRMAARRRRNILVGLAGSLLAAILLSLMISFFVILAVLVAFALVAYVGMMSYMALVGDLSMSPRISVGEDDRHVAHAVAWGDEESWWEDIDDHGDEDQDQIDDDWWQQQRVVGR